MIDIHANAKALVKEVSECTAWRDERYGRSLCDLVEYAKSLEKEIAAMKAQARAAINQTEIPEGMALVPKAEFDDLMYWLDRCDEKGHLDNCPDLIEPLQAFNQAMLAAQEQKP
jgi:hypothetical protein